MALGFLFLGCIEKLGDLNMGSYSISEYGSGTNITQHVTLGYRRGNTIQFLPSVRPNL